MHKFFSRHWMILFGILALLLIYPLFLQMPKNVAANQEDEITAPVTDLVVDAMEVTQAMQDLNNSVPLVGGKKT